MTLYPLLRASWACWTPAAPAQTRERLHNAVRTGELSGTVSEHSFAVQHKVLGVKNSWRPQLQGKLAAAGGGTLVTVSLSVHPVVIAFTVLHGLLLFGLAWILGIAAFSWGVGTATKTLGRVVGATAIGEAEIAAALPVADPLQPGAESQAPFRLQATVSAEGVRFRVPGAATLRGLGPVKHTVIEVDGRCVTIGEAQIPWDSLARCEVSLEERELVLLRSRGDVFARVPCDGLQDEDIIWLASYLEAFAQRLAISPEDQHRQDTERTRIAALMRNAGQER